VTHFTDFSPAEPDLAHLRTAYDGLLAAAAETGPGDLIDVVDRWDDVRQDAWTWLAWARVRYRQDTRDVEARERRERADQAGSELEQLDLQLQRVLLARGADLSEVPPYAVARWTAAASALDPAIAERRVTEQTVVAEYTALMGSASFDVRGQAYSLTTISPLLVHPDRAVRHEAQAAKWAWFAEHGAELDDLYDRLTKLRAGMATDLGHDDFVQTGYLRMGRVDYGREDVDRWRREVQRHLVPLGRDLREAQRERLGMDRLHYWDHGVYESAGNPVPVPVPEQAEAAARAFDGLDDDIAGFWRGMIDRGMMDLPTRPGKAGGGFCTYFSNLSTPFIFCNGAGVHSDIKTLVHEAGHAYQKHASRGVRPKQLLHGTADTAEIHSMSLEFLTWPRLGEFFGDDAEQFRRTHLTESLLFLPYGVAIDHFQHLVYESPDATPAERHAMWKSMEERYLPWQDAGDLDHVAGGGAWQQQRHIYNYPFYYIDYTLALCCALQFWDAAQDDPDEALTRYKALCALGGSQPFQSLVKAVGLRSPFEEGCLESVVARARTWLGL